MWKLVGFASRSLLPAIAKLHAVIMLTYSMKEPNNYDNPEAEELTITSKQASQQGGDSE